MPDQGTADTVHILKVVKDHRPYVWTSVLVQIFSSLVDLPALFFLIKDTVSPNAFVFWGVILLSIGAMGMCADAFFHLLAFFMTHPYITIDDNIIMVMELMQTRGILLLIPLLLLFFVGSLILAIGLFKLGISSNKSVIILVSAIVVGLVGALLVNLVLGYGRPILPYWYWVYLL